jgi:hypothetical protein
VCDIQLTTGFVFGIILVKVAQRLLSLLPRQGHAHGVPFQGRQKDASHQGHLSIVGYGRQECEWPTGELLSPSYLTLQGGGTMFCGSGFKPATASLFHDANSKRGGVLMHTKMIIALFEPKANQLGIEGSSTSSGKRKASEITENKDDVGGWVYVGSHNFSAAAWVSTRSFPAC